MKTDKEIKLYTLSTCVHCARARQYFRDRDIAVECVDVDLAEGEARRRLIEEVRRLNHACTFPTICIGDCVIAGFNEGKINEALEMRT
jgi:glutaredoxin-like protein NrdH